MTLALLAELRAATTLPIDLYMEAPSSMGGWSTGTKRPSWSRWPRPCT